MEREMGLPFRQAVKVLVISAIATCGMMLSSCVQDMRTFDIDSTYAVVTTDIRADTALCYKLGNGSCIGRVDGQVVAVGWDANYIIVERHPGGNPSAVEYYILVRRNDGPYAEPEESVVGPFDKSAFAEARSKTGVPTSLTFSKRFD